MVAKDSFLDLDKERAKFAFECATNGINNEDDGRYSSHVKKIPMLIKTNGLGPAFAFIFSKGKVDSNKDGDKAYNLIYVQTKEWIEKNPVITYDKEAEDSFMEYIVSLPSDKYKNLTVEIIAFLNWVRRFADGMEDDENVKW